MLLEPSGFTRRDKSPIKWDDSSPFVSSKPVTSRALSKVPSAVASNQNSERSSKAPSRTLSNQPSARISNVILA